MRTLSLYTYDDGNLLLVDAVTDAVEGNTMSWVINESGEMQLVDNTNHEEDDKLYFDSDIFTRIENAKQLYRDDTVPSLAYVNFLYGLVEEKVKTISK